MGKMYCLVVTDDYSRFSWVFFLAKKDETSGILKDFITRIENQLNHKVKIIRCDNGTEFNNYDMNQFCGIKGIKREFSNARTPQQNGVAERKNRTLIEAARTMLADSLLPIPFWAEAVNTACFMRPFGCPVTILNTLDHLVKFDGKADEGFLVGYSINTKAFRVFNSRTRKVEENLHVNFLENKPNVVGSGPKWLFDIDTLINSINYQPVSVGNRTNGNAGLETNSDTGQAGKENVSDQEYILLPLLHTSSNVPSNSKKDESSPKVDARKKNEVKDLAKEGDMNGPGEVTNTDSTNRLNIVSSPVNMILSDLQDTGIFGGAYDDEYVGVEDDLSNLETNMSISPIPTTIIHKDHPKAQIIREVDSAMEPKKTLVDLPHGKKAIGTKWVFRNKRDQRGIVVRNKARLVAQGYRQEEGVDYDEVFAPIARIEAIRLFLAFASFMGFTVYQIDVKSTFLYGTIEEEVYVNQPPGFVDPEFPNRVYKVEKALYGLHQAPRAWYETLSTYLLENRFRRGTIDKTLFIKKIKNDILLVQVYVDDIIFGSTNESLSTEFEQLMYKRFQMSSIGELTFFLGLQVEQRKYGIFLSQPTLGLWYPKDSPMDLIAYSDSYYAGASIDRKSTIGGCHFLGCRMERAATTASSLEGAGQCHIQYALIENPTIYVSFIKQFWRTATARTSATREVELTATIDGQEKTIIEAFLRRHLKLEDNGGVNTLPNSEIFEQLTLMRKLLPCPHDIPLQSVHSLGRDEGSLSLHELTVLCTNLSNKVKKLEQTVKTSQSRRRTRVVLSDEEEVSEDPSKQGRSLIETLDLDAEISLVPPHDAEIQEKISDDTEVLLEEEETTELIEEPIDLVEDQGSGEKGEQEVTTVDTALNTASVPISTRTNYGGFMWGASANNLSVKSKKQLEQERLSHEEDIRLQEQIDEEERKRIARDFEIAKQLQEEYDKAGKKEAIAEVVTAHVIDWNDPSVKRMKDFKGMSYDDIRPIFEKVWDQVHSFVPMDSEEEVQRLKRAGQDVEAKPAKRQRTKEVSESVQEQTDEEPKIDELSQEQLNQMVFEDMLKNFDRDDLVKLWSLVQERYNSSGLTEDKEIELWVELKMLFEPDAENLLELQKYMHDPLKWWLYDMCAVHYVSTEKGQDIFMLVEKDYPLTKGLATLMLCNKLRMDQHSEMADELLIKIYNIANRPRK
ncbi:putative ribonuclease H-like domain-containing protein [Tanacetum coccineum]